MVCAQRNQELLGLEHTEEIQLEPARLPQARFWVYGSTHRPQPEGSNYLLPNMLEDLVAHTFVPPTCADQFIDPTTRFCRTEKNGYPAGIPGRFLIEARYWLEPPRGACHELSAHLRVSLETILYNLYSLRQSGYVPALDAFRLQQPLNPPPTRRSLWKRLAKRLHLGLGPYCNTPLG